MTLLDTTHPSDQLSHLDYPPFPTFPTPSRIHPLQDRTMPPPNSIIPQSLSRKRQSLPLRDDLPTASTSTSKPSSPSTAPLSSPDPDDTEYAPSRGKRRAGGKGGSSRPVSREALRKANHSLIERRRREKINYALGELRGMVPGLGDTGGGQGGEFKLEVNLVSVGVIELTVSVTGAGEDGGLYEGVEAADRGSRGEAWRG